MGCEVAVAVVVPEIDVACVPEREALTPEECMIIRLYRGLSEHDQEWMRRMISALAARSVPG
jgi:hypothetical protein